MFIWFVSPFIRLVFPFALGSFSQVLGIYAIPVRGTLPLLHLRLQLVHLVLDPSRKVRPIVRPLATAARLWTEPGPPVLPRSSVEDSFLEAGPCYPRVLGEVVYCRCPCTDIEGRRRVLPYKRLRHQLQDLIAAEDRGLEVKPGGVSYGYVRH